MEGKEYNYDGKLIFEGKYKNGEMWSGKITKYEYDSLKFEGEYLNGKEHIGKEYRSDGKLIFEGKYKNGKNGMEQYLIIIIRIITN